MPQDQNLDQKPTQIAIQVFLQGRLYASTLRKWNNFNWSPVQGGLCGDLEFESFRETAFPYISVTVFGTLRLNNCGRSELFQKKKVIIFHFSAKDFRFRCRDAGGDARGAVSACPRGRPLGGESAQQPSSKDGSSPPAGGTASASMVCMPRPPLVLLSHHLISHCPCAPTGIFSDGRRAVPACPGRRLRTVGAAAVPTQRTLSSFRCRNGAYHLPDFH